MALRNIPQDRIGRLVSKLRRNGLRHIKKRRIQAGLEAYQSIMCLYQRHGSQNIGFQKQYKRFYRVRRSARWCGNYFSMLDELKRRPMSFREILQALYDQTNKYDPPGKVEASFASKMLATNNPKCPVIDKWVLKNFGERLPYSYVKPKDRLEKAEQCYRRLVQRYRQLLIHRDGKWLISFFDKICPNSGITSIKKIDLILWQARG